MVWPRASFPHGGYAGPSTLLLSFDLKLAADGHAHGGPIKHHPEPSRAGQRAIQQRKSGEGAGGPPGWPGSSAAGGGAGHGLVNLVQDEGDSELRQEQDEDLPRRLG